LEFPKAWIAALSIASARHRPDRSSLYSAGEINLYGTEFHRELGLTILLITHEMNVVRNICDEVAILDRGTLVEKGTVREIVLEPHTPLARQFAQSAWE